MKNATNATATTMSSATRKRTAGFAFCCAIRSSTSSAQVYRTHPAPQPVSGGATHAGRQAPHGPAGKRLTGRPASASSADEDVGEVFEQVERAADEHRAGGTRLRARERDGGVRVRLDNGRREVAAEADGRD